MFYFILNLSSKNTKKTLDPHYFYDLLTALRVTVASDTYTYIYIYARNQVLCSMHAHEHGFLREDRAYHLVTG